jgi:hypothetical protein
MASCNRAATELQQSCIRAATCMHAYIHTYWSPMAHARRSSSVFVLFVLVKQVTLSTWTQFFFFYIGVLWRMLEEEEKEKWVQVLNLLALLVLKHKYWRVACILAWGSLSLSLYVYIYIIFIYICIYVCIYILWGAQFTCFTSTKAQMLTRQPRAPRHSPVQYLYVWGRI